MIPTPEEAEEQLEQDHIPSIRAKWMFNGCSTLEEMQEKLEEVKGRMGELKEAGFEVTQNNDDDYIYIEKVE